MSQFVNHYIKTHSKSYMLCFFATAILGPVGLLYLNWLVACILIAVLVMGINTVAVPVIVWLVAIVTGFMSVYKHNRKVSTKAFLNGTSEHA